MSRWEPSPEAVAFVPSSVMLQRLHDEAPADHFTLDWLMTSLHKRSFGIIMLLLAIVAMAPGVCVVAGLLLMIPAFQMVKGRSAPLFPRRIAAHSLPTRRLAVLVQRAVPVLRRLEHIIHPRWPALLGAFGRVDGIIILILAAFVSFVPIPFSNIVPAVVIALISLAHLEEDGAVRAIGLLLAIAILVAAALMVWETLHGVEWINGLW
jgi:hypothetical protein